MVPFFYRWGSTASRLQPFWGGSLLFTIQFPEIPGTHQCCFHHTPVLSDFVEILVQMLCGHFWGDYFPPSCFLLLFLVDPLSFFFASCFNFLFSPSSNFASSIFSLALFLSSVSFSFLTLICSFSLYNSWWIICI